jgi:hypothetical protein
MKNEGHVFEKELDGILYSVGFHPDFREGQSSFGNGVILAKFVVEKKDDNYNIAISQNDYVSSMGQHSHIAESFGLKYVIGGGRIIDSGDELCIGDISSSFGSVPDELMIDKGLVEVIKEAVESHPSVKKSDYQAVYDRPRKNC